MMAWLLSQISKKEKIVTSMQASGCTLCYAAQPKPNPVELGFPLWQDFGDHSGRTDSQAISNGGMMIELKDLKIS